jgi:hypothetical protein
MGEDSDDKGYIPIDLDDEMLMPVGKKLRDCDGIDLVTSALALLSYVYRSAVDKPGLSERRRRAVSRDLIAYFVSEVRSLADPSHDVPIQ